MFKRIEYWTKTFEFCLFVWEKFRIIDIPFSSFDIHILLNVWDTRTEENYLMNYKLKFIIILSIFMLLSPSFCVCPFSIFNTLAKWSIQKSCYPLMSLISIDVVILVIFLKLKLSSERVCDCEWGRSKRIFQEFSWNNFLFSQSFLHFI